MFSTGGEPPGPAAFIRDEKFLGRRGDLPSPDGPGRIGIPEGPHIGTPSPDAWQDTVARFGLPVPDLALDDVGGVVLVGGAIVGLLVLAEVLD